MHLASGPWHRGSHLRRAWSTPSTVRRDLIRRATAPPYLVIKRRVIPAMSADNDLLCCVVAVP
jgi:hypothetical protein